MNTFSYRDKCIFPSPRVVLACQLMGFATHLYAASCRGVWKHLRCWKQTLYERKRIPGAAPEAWWCFPSASLRPKPPGCFGVFSPFAASDSVNHIHPLARLQDPSKQCLSPLKLCISKATYESWLKQDVLYQNRSMFVNTNMINVFLSSSEA